MIVSGIYTMPQSLFYKKKNTWNCKKQLASKVAKKEKII
jgi:hypothetical protein